MVRGPTTVLRVSDKSSPAAPGWRVWCLVDGGHEVQAVTIYAFNAVCAAHAREIVANDREAYYRDLL